MLRRFLRLSSVAILCTFAFAALSAANTYAAPKPPTYTNPLPIVYPKHGQVENCPDPAIIRGNAPDTAWYAYCGQAQLNAKDKTGKTPNSHRVPILKSTDLVHWTYTGDAFSATPAWVGAQGLMSAPDVLFDGTKYLMYYSVNDSADAVSGEPGCTDDSAVGLATATAPSGPWVDFGSPVVTPHRSGPNCAFYRQYYPDVVTDGGQTYIFFGEWSTGLQMETLAADGTTFDVATQVQVGQPYRYESPHLIKHDGFWYLLASASSGYNIFAGRAATPAGPFVDNTGASFTDARVGGTPVLNPNGNRWVLPRHATTFTDLAGTDWLLYNAVDVKDKSYNGTTNYLPCAPAKCRLLLDRLDWVNGWPMVRNGAGASDTKQPVPVAQSGQTSSPPTNSAPTFTLGPLLPQYSDEFDGTAFATQWSWIRQPQPSGFAVTSGAFRFDTAAADLYLGFTNNAPVLREAMPKGNVMIETKLTFTPGDGDDNNYYQAGLVVYGNDDSYVKLVHESLHQTRQIEFGKEAAKGFYGSLFGGAPSDTTYLRIVKQVVRGKEQYSAYSSTDGTTFVSAGTWTAKLGSKASIGLVAMGGAGFFANFDYVHVYQLAK